MFTNHRNTRARRSLLPIAAVLAASTLGMATSADAAGCTVLDQPPGRAIAHFAPFDGQINPGQPNGLDQPMVPALCRPDTP